MVKNKCKNNSDVKIISLDLEDYTNLKSKVNEAIACFGHIDILVNNGGMTDLKSVFLTFKII